MCGILTYYSKNGITKDNINECLLSLNTIKHRGPDGEGIVLINSITGENKTILTKDTPKDINCDFNEFTEIEDDHYDLLLVIWFLQLPQKPPPDNLSILRKSHRRISLNPIS